MEQENLSAIDDPFDLKRFLRAQEIYYEQALSELKKGRKRTHWIWFVFPQLDGLARSYTSKLYSIKSIEEAAQYLAHPVLGKRLKECAEAVLANDNPSISEILGSPDDLKLKSSMTLFAGLANSDSVFVSVLSKFYSGERDLRTIELLKTMQQKNS